MNKVLLVFVSLGLLLFTISLVQLRQPIDEVVGVPELVDEVLPTPQMEEEPQIIELVAVGDVMLGRSVNTAMVSRNDWTFPFLETAPRLAQADIAFGNLESPFGEVCPISNEGFIFCADKRSVEGLVFAGFDVMSLANNHALNQGQSGLELSNTLLEENGIRGVVQEELEIIEKNGFSTAWLAYDAVAGTLDQELVSTQITLANQQADLVIVSLHWGWEYNADPNPYQQQLAHHVIDSGADLIIGHHPHWRQTVEEYKGKTIFYSLGNFVFDQMWSEETRLGSVAFITLDKEGLVEYKIETVKIYDYAQPRWEEQLRFSSNSLE